MMMIIIIIIIKLNFFFVFCCCCCFFCRFWNSKCPYEWMNQCCFWEKKIFPLNKMNVLKKISGNEKFHWVHTKLFCTKELLISFSIYSFWFCLVKVPRKNNRNDPEYEYEKKRQSFRLSSGINIFILFFGCCCCCPNINPNNNNKNFKLWIQCIG